MFSLQVTRIQNIKTIDQINKEKKTQKPYQKFVPVTSVCPIQRLPQYK